MTPSQDEAVADILVRWQPYGRAGLLPCLIDVQNHLGWLPPDVCAQVGEVLGVPLADVYGVATFYSLLYTQPVGRRIVRVCDDVACLANGSPALLEACRTALGLAPGETSPDGLVTLEVHPCLGHCEHAPCLMVNDQVFGRLDAAAAERLARAVRAGEASPEVTASADRPTWQAIPGYEAHLLRRVGQVDPTSLADYEAHGGYRALRAALEMTPAEIIGMVKASGLVGRGGAAFPTGIKWESAARQPVTPRYVVCNADESEPGTFKDRVLMEGDPFAIVEAMTIAAYAVGAEQGYIYVRGEFRAAYERLANAVAAAREAGYLGKRVLGSDFSFDIELRRGAGAYVCGEETALFESIEGKRGMPRQKPPFPTERGLFGRPTVINNVETFANVPHIVLNGPDWFRRIGPPDAPGPKLFCVSGAVERPGVYEGPMSVTLRQLVEVCGGVRPGRKIQAVLVGGAAGTFVPAEHLDTPVSFEALRAIGASLGSGAVLVVDDSVDMLEVVERITRFFAHESCGKCYPCQLGTQRQWEIVRRWQAGHHRPDDAERLQDIAHAMREASICGLGQTAASALMSVLPLLAGRFEEDGS